jgi:three-Cys-motif partner protein
VTTCKIVSCKQSKSKEKYATTSAVFGGDWTAEKLERVRKYLVAYAKIMRRQQFRFAYIDAFAGTGYRLLKQEEGPNELMFPELVEQESKEFLEGSARVALQIQPRFTKYILIEKDLSRFTELQKLKEEYPALQSDIIIVNANANEYIKDLCQNFKWHKNRAVLFLDPFGMQVTWETVVAIAKTKAIDMWYLFPLGVAVNRLLKKDGNINEAIRQKLDEIFGTSDWYDAFYQTKTNFDLFGEHTRKEKIARFDLIEKYFVERLTKVFEGVAKNPLPLINSRNNPLYLLCFASGNPQGARTAVKIAQDILKRS